MKKTLSLLFGLILLFNKSNGQTQNKNTIFIVDHIPIIEEPKEGEDSLDPNEIAEVEVVKNKDSLKVLGYEKMDQALLIFTKEYKKRSDEIKKIPTTRLMIRQDEKWYLKGSSTPYSGHFIDYYYSGKKQGEGILREGRLNGRRTMYYSNGHLSIERNYENGIENGTEMEFYEDGSLSQKGDFINGSEEGVWEMYYPNGHIKQHNTFKNGKMVGESLTYYSTGRVKAKEIIIKGKALADPRLKNIQKLYDKGIAAEREGDHKQAVKKYTKCLEIDSSYAEAYFSRGTAKLNNQQFDEAINDFDKALLLEPYFKEALANRAFCRIQKYQTTRTLSGNKDVTVLAVRDKAPIPEQEAAKICSDLQKAFFLDSQSPMLRKALSEYCNNKSH